MGTPGSGRYTKYMPSKSKKYDLLYRLFKFGATNIYESDNNADAAVKTSQKALALFNAGIGDADMFPSGVKFGYGEAPDTTTVKWTQAGDPANPYVPDISSPGPGKTDGTDKDADPKIETTDIKPNFDPANPTVNTTSPDTTSPRLGTMSFGENLTPGKSSAV